jgi:hypothetical protein
LVHCTFDFNLDNGRFTSYASTSEFS